MKPLLLMALVLSSAAASAAPQPSKGTLHEGSGSLSFTGGPFTAPNPTSDRVYLGDTEGRSILMCEEAAVNCDRYALTVDLPERFRQSAANKKQVLRISLSVQEQQPLPLMKPNFHIYVFDARGTELGRSEFSSFQGSVDAHLDLPLTAVPNGGYTVTVTGYNGLGASYSAAVDLGNHE